MKSQTFKKGPVWLNPAALNFRHRGRVRGACGVAYAEASSVLTATPPGSSEVASDSGDEASSSSAACTEAAAVASAAEEAYGSPRKLREVGVTFPNPEHPVMVITITVMLNFGVVRKNHSLPLQHCFGAFPHTKTKFFKNAHKLETRLPGPKESAQLLRLA